ncbi:fructose-1,6-bisphosphate aldolase [Perkinsela sp. CCAP 1560/4]|nr:fructose-1,6-bisphosphate aldolase [Perkinsela sp. CCAP 1560/4]|eukprot:KNH08032.1 fructose-1,6-bisphosphate aldolase [Perkinsela sp. CCAP 1560/4]
MSRRVEILESHLSIHRPTESPYRDELIQTVSHILRPGKGLLAADESMSTVEKRFKTINLPNTDTNRRRFREFLFSAPGLNEYVSGVILHEETLGQKNSKGTSFVESLSQQGILAGVKTDKGVVPFVGGAPGEQATQGLDDYLARASAFYKQGARFCKWRNVFKIQCGTVSDKLVQHNAETLARYALLSQQAGLVPIVEPEVMIDGTHSIDECARVSERVWFAVAQKLHEYGVIWEGMLLKPNMVLPGIDCPKKATAQEIARATVTTLSRTIPAACRGVVFLSGGLSEVQATEYLNAMNSKDLKAPRPWALRFSYARALQNSAIKAWQGKDQFANKGQAVLLHRARMNSNAARGIYRREEDDSVSESLYVKDHKY